MLKRFVGASGLQVSALSFGTMSFGKGGLYPGVGGVELPLATRMIDMALDAGVTLFDSADAYSRGESEELLGQALGPRRKNVVVATKVFGRMGEGDHDFGVSRRHVVQACEDSLRRLGTDWIDLYQIHTWDSLVPVDETLRALDDLVRAGKVRYIGCSNFAGWQLAKSIGRSQMLGLHAYISQQIQYSLVAREAEHELIAAGIDHGVGALVWGPLGSGYLTGKFRNAEVADSRLNKLGRLAMIDTPANRAVVDALYAIGEELGANCGQVAIAWLLRKPGVSSVILGAQREAQLADNLGAAALRLSDAHMEQLDKLSAVTEPYPLTHHHSSGAERNPRRPAWIDYTPG